MENFILNSLFVSISKIGIYQASGSMANDIGSFFIGGVNGKAIQNFITNTNLKNGFGLIGTYYGSTVGLKNDGNQLKNARK